MNVIRRVAVGAAVAAMLAAPALAESPQEFAIHARQGLMQNFVFNLAQLGAMAKGQMPYDATRAKIASGNLVRLSGVDMEYMWPKGSDDTHYKNTHAKPAIWEHHTEFLNHLSALRTAADSMNKAAGVSLASLRKEMRPLGHACGACHHDFRADED